MLAVGITIATALAVVVAARLRRRPCRRLLLGGAASALLVLLPGIPASAAVVPTVPLGTAGGYSVLAGTTVTNTGASVLAASLGVSPGSAITGFPPGVVLPPGTTNAANPAALQAQSDLTAAYVNAAGRPIDATTTADLANLVLQGGVYAGPAKGALSLTGPLVLDGAGDPRTVFIFQTDSSLTTGSGSTVALINGAQECNVFWQVGSSATLGTGSVFAGTILALTSVTVTTDVTVRGRALARNGAVTLDDDTFTTPTCATSIAAPSTSTTTTSTTARPAVTVTTPTTTPPSATTVPGVAGGSGAPAPAAPTATSPTGAVGDGSATGSVGGAGIQELPRTGSLASVTFGVAMLFLVAGAAALWFGARRPPHAAAHRRGRG